MEEVLPIKEDKRNKKWMTGEIMSLMRDRRGAKQSQNVEVYKEIIQTNKTGVCECKGQLV